MARATAGRSSMCTQSQTHVYSEGDLNIVLAED